jgi:hypothetical protein
MTAQRQIPGGPFVNETATAQRQIPGGPFINEVVPSSNLPTLSAPTIVPGSLTGVGFRPRVTITF